MVQSRSKTSSTDGVLGPDDALRVTVESDRLVAFGDGLEADHLDLSYGQTVTLRRSATHLSLG